MHGLRICGMRVYIIIVYSINIYYQIDLGVYKTKDNKIKSSLNLIYSSRAIKGQIQTIYC